MDHEPPDRGRPAGDDPLGQARRQDLDPDLPRQARHEEAGRDPDGLRQGRPDHWVAVVKPGRILFEMAGVPHEEAAEAMRLASHKLPVATRVVSRDGAIEGGER